MIVAAHKHALCFTLIVAGSGCAERERDLVTDFDESELGPTEGFDIKADGFVFTRTLDPGAITVDGEELSGTFSADRYVAHTFDLDAPLRFDVVFEFGWWESVQNGFWFPHPPFTSEALLFRYDEAATSDAPEARWDLVVHGEPAGDVSLSYAGQPGRYMVVVLGSPAAYSRRAAFDLALRRDTSIEAATPGTVDVWVVGADSKRVVSGRRVAIGTSAAVTDERGQARLAAIPAGRYELKVGELGTDPVDFPPSPTIDVYGQDTTQTQILIVDD